MKHGYSSSHTGKRSGAGAQGGMKQPKFGDSGCHGLEAGKKRTPKPGSISAINAREGSKMKGHSY